MSNISVRSSMPVGHEEIDTKKSKCKDIIFKRIPILAWLPKYTGLDAVSDMVAGITLGLTMIPQSIAYATLAELGGQYGLYSCVAGSFLYVVFGTIKEVSIGPTSLMSLLLLEFTRNLPIDFVVLLTFLAGCMELLMGLLNLGFLVDFISTPVTSGFTSATSVIIIISQLPGLFGIKYQSHSIFDNFIKFFHNVSNFRIGDTLCGCLSIIFLLVFRKIKDLDCRCIENKKRIVLKKVLWFLCSGRNALLVAITTIISYIMETRGMSPFILSGSIIYISVLRKIEAGLPSLDPPKFSTQFKNETYTLIDMCSTLGSGIIVIPLVAVLVNIAIAKAFSTGATIDATQEMFALGLCNIFGSFVHSVPTCGAFTRSAVINASGVRTPLSGLYAGTMAILALSFLTPYFYFIPRAALSAVLIAAVYFMIDWSILWTLWKGSKKDIVATIGTFMVCIISTVEIGLVFGVALNLMYLFHAWARPSVYVTTCKSEHGDDYILIKPDVGFYYPSVDFLRGKINQVAIQKQNRSLPIVLDCDHLKGIDYTAVQGLQSIVKDFDTRGQRILFYRLSPSVWETIQKFGLINNLSREENETDLINNLFGTKVVNRRRSAEVPVCTENDDHNITSYNDRNDTEDGSIELEQKESLLTEYAAVIKELESVDEGPSKQQGQD